MHSKSSSHSEARDSTVVKYSFQPEAVEALPVNRNIPPRIESTASLASLNHSGPSSPTGYSTPPVLEPPHPVASGSGSNGNGNGHASGSGGGWSGFASRMQRNYGSQDAPTEESGEDHEAVKEEEDTEISTEIDIVVDVPLPIWTTPTHTVHPVFVNHKIKWSAFIK